MTIFKTYTLVTKIIEVPSEEVLYENDIYGICFKNEHYDDYFDEQDIRKILNLKEEDIIKSIKVQDIEDRLLKIKVMVKD